MRYEGTTTPAISSRLTPRSQLSPLFSGHADAFGADRDDDFLVQDVLDRAEEVLRDDHRAVLDTAEVDLGTGLPDVLHADACVVHPLVIVLHSAPFELDEPHVIAHVLYVARIPLRCLDLKDIGAEDELRTETKRRTFIRSDHLALGFDAVAVLRHGLPRLPHASRLSCR